MRILIYNARILTMNSTFEEIENGWLIIENTRLFSLGHGECSEDIRAFDQAFDVNGDLIMPGMVNTHCHMPMTLFRGLGEDVDDRLFRYILPLERELVTPDVVRVGARLAALEMMLGGVTTTADMYYHEIEIGRVLDAAGMRGVVGQTLADYNPPDHSSLEQGFDLVQTLADTFRDTPRITASIAPHAPYSTGPKILEKVAEFADANPEIRIQMHLAEMQSEMEWCDKHHNCRPVALADKTGVLRSGAIMAHCLEVTPDEISLLAERGVKVAHNARSNAKAGRGIAPVEAMRTAGISVGLASDGAMSGNTLDILAQMAPASMFAKLRGGSRACLPAKEVVRMATLEGANVLGLDADIGSLEPGKCADLIRVSLASPRLQPIYDTYAMLVFSANASDVCDVMVDGKWLVQNRICQTLEQPKVMHDAAEIAVRFRMQMHMIDTLQ